MATRNVETAAYIIDIELLPERYPTNSHSSDFWAALGRAVATFGYLEDTLARAIVALTTTDTCPAGELEAKYDALLKKAKNALTDQLHNLIKSYVETYRAHCATEKLGFDRVIDSLHESQKTRNMICQAFWPAPNKEGYSLPRFFTKEGKWETLVDVQYLEQVQRAVAELACKVENSVTHMGWQFPGSKGPGVPIMK